MSSRAEYATGPRIGFAAVSTANTGRDGTGTIIEALQTQAAPSKGTRIERIVLAATANPADSVVNAFLSPDSGTTWYFWRAFDIGDPAAASTTLQGWESEHLTPDLSLPTGWSIGFAITVAPTSGNMNVFVFGSEYE